ncbi:MAG: thermonuclease family protein [Hyphomicrobiaceae bacterium]|nr:thermonuclease family protein [Hyphomicrobiaceae bacterium]
MRESDRRHIVRGLGALSLAGLLALVLAIVSPPELSQAAAPDPVRSAIAGPARVVDGDTISVGDVRVRLEGIDAPETAQQCSSQGRGAWSCGTAATRALSALVAGKEVQCDSTGNDRYGRTLAICRVGALELNAEMVRRGLAWAFVRYSQRLVAVEAEARKLRLGIWQSENEPAWVYRADRWSYAEAEAPRGCAIKGNISDGGRIYHVPWSPHYSAVRIDATRGERWFCSEAEAIAAGWRPAGSR